MERRFSAPSLASVATARFASRPGARRRPARSSPLSRSSMELGGRVALVTGAGRRVGRAIALALAAKGMRLAVHYHASADEAEETARLALAAGAPHALTISADLRDAHACARLIDEVASRDGSLDVLVNSAAEMHRTPFDSVTPEEWDDIMSLNLGSPFFCSQAAARHMAGGGA